MVRYCAANNCSNRAGSAKFKRFPSSMELRQVWINNMGQPNFNLGGNAEAYLCEDHFTLDDLRSGKRKLVPAIFCKCEALPLQDVTTNKDPLHDHSFLPAKMRRIDKENSMKRPRGRPLKSVMHESSCPLLLRRQSLSNGDTLDFGKSVEQNSTDSGVSVSNFSNSANHSLNVSSDIEGSLLPCNNSSLLDLSSCSNVFESTRITSDTDHEVEINSAANSFVEEASLFTSNSMMCEPVSCKSLTPKVTSVFKSKRPNLSISQPVILDIPPAQSIFNDISRAKIVATNFKLRRKVDTLRKRAVFWEKKLKAFQAKFTSRVGKDQVDVLASGSAHGKKWLNSTVEKALQLLFTSGPTGYKQQSNLQMPLPSIRTLQRRLQHMKFEAGVLVNIFKLIGRKTRSMKAMHKDCVLVYDEMAIKKKIDYNPGTKKYVGRCTLPAALQKVTNKMKAEHPIHEEREEYRKELSLAALNERACKAIVWMLGGLAFRWKQPVAYDFTSTSVDPEYVKNTTLEVITQAYNVGLIVRAVTSDMGNRAVWTKLGVDVGPSSLVNSFPHPCNPELKVFVLADVIHAFKNFKEMLVSNEIITLSKDVVEDHDLPSQYVKIAHIISLIEYQMNDTWKMTPKLNMDCVKSCHFEKMKVGNSRKVINHTTAASLMELASEDSDNNEMITTAWFIMLVHEWFRFVTSRSLASALSKKNMEQYNRAITILKLTMHVFQNMNVGNAWKPVQTAIKISTKSILDLADLCLNDLQYDFLCTGRLTQDMIENLFSLIRCIRPTPSALQFIQRLRQICVAMFLRPIPSSSYDFDGEGEGLVLINFLEELKYAALDCVAENDNGWPKEFTLLSVSIPEKEKRVMYRVAGYVLFQVFRVTKLNKMCHACQTATVHQGPEPHRYGNFTRLTNYYEGAQIEVSDEVFNLVMKAEECYQGLIHVFINLKKTDLFLADRMKDFPRLYSPNLPTCHDIANKLLTRFIQMRQKLGVAKDNNTCSSKNSAFGSLSMGSRLLASNFKKEVRY